MNTKIFYLILLILTNVSCTENKDKATVLNKNLPVSISQRWDQLKKGKDQKNEKALISEFIKAVQEKGYGIANPTYVSYDGKASPLTGIGYAERCVRKSSKPAESDFALRSGMAIPDEGISKDAQ